MSCVNSTTIVRVLMEPSSNATKLAADGYPIEVASKHKNCGRVSPTAYSSLVSPSFLPILRKSLEIRSEVGKCGGHWFWETYQHALSGESLTINISGTSVSLAEDSIESQLTLRQKDGLALTDEALSNVTAKLEIIFALALSVTLRVSQQPLLEDDEGPSALVLCATRRQCDEFTYVLNQFCGSLRLVVHNLFEPYPSMPRGKRSDIVVGTVPLWDSISALNTENRMGLEDVLCHISGERVSSTYASTRWRPYNYSHISQLVLLDVSCQVCLGFAPRLLEILASHPSGGARLPRQCQVYIINAGDRYVANDVLCQQLASEVRGFALRGESEHATLSLRRVRRPFVEVGQQDDTPELPSKRAKLEKQAVTGLLIRNALSLPRLLADEPEALDDLFGGIQRTAGTFWDSFRGDAPQPPGAGWEELSALLGCKLALIGTASRDDGSDYDIREVGALITPSSLSETDGNRTRLHLLFQHLEESLSGQMFDGSVISCMNVADLQLREAYEFQPLEPHTDGWLTSEGGVLKDLVKNAVYLRAILRPPAIWESAWQQGQSARDQLVHAFGTSFPEDGWTGTPGVPSVPRFMALPGTRPNHPVTVLVQRRVAESAKTLCCVDSEHTSPGTLDASRPTSCPAWSILGECCQYGRVLSYYCYDQPGLAPTASPLVEGASADHDEGTPLLTASLFVEFETHESALEALRCFQARLGAWSLPPAQLHLFRNALYYDGIRQDMTRRGEAADSDEEADDFLDISYLAE